MMSMEFTFQHPWHHKELFSVCEFLEESNTGHSKARGDVDL